MDRRQAARTLVFGVVGAGIATAASAQTYYPPPLPPAEAAEAAETGQVGSLSLYASRVAQHRAYRTDVREFADFETAEQTTIGEILQELTGAPPPPLSYAQRADLERLESLGGPAFEHEYVRLQLEGHRQLLAIQDRYLAYGRVPSMRHVALLARGQILEHLRLLTDVQRRGA